MRGSADHNSAGGGRSVSGDEWAAVGGSELHSEVAQLDVDTKSRRAGTASGLVIAIDLRSNLAMIPGAKRAQILKALQSNPNWAAVARQVGGVNRATVGVIARQLGINPAKAARQNFPRKRVRGSRRR